MLTAVEILQLKEIIQLLKPLEFMTTEASGEQYVTISKEIPMVNYALQKIKSLNLQYNISKQLKSRSETEFKKDLVPWSGSLMKLLQHY